MNSESLLERISNQYNGYTPLGSNQERLLASIIRNLECILNHQQGSAMAEPDLGLPDLNSSKFGDGLKNIRWIERSIERTILNYEPRCSAVKVTIMEEKSSGRISLIFKVNMSVMWENKIVPVLFETILGMDGRIRVEHT